MLDLEQLWDNWMKMSIKQRLSLIKRVIIESIILSIIAILFFWITLITMWVATLLISPDPYILSYVPNYHLQNFKDFSLVTAFINQNHKVNICAQQNPSYFNDLTINYNQFCNIQHNQLPILANKAEIRLKNIQTTVYRYIRGCIKYPTKKLTCQKYFPKESIVLFTAADVLAMEYLYVELQINDKYQTVDDRVVVEFEEDCWFITKVYKDHYHIFTLIYTYGLTLTLTGGVIIVRVAYMLKRVMKKQSKDQQVKAGSLGKSPTEILKQLQKNKDV